ncbi:MFS transporter [Actinokineospora auranticolor]|uniref:Putative MFS family arabinose efflux permease n=1 Tax=Actinokineospora auranticolor TaxID=155976 RepID=A0A2S6GBR3_9PSEU|nr:MFS transporter [Actinokineospora auranticolor]PPK61715.1 putative MFS family arabinose efflux permease [Actinokineospora auranticolor]
MRGSPDRRLGWLLSSSALSNLGDGIGKTAFPLLGASLTRDPVLIGGLSATAFLPWLLFSLVSGAMLDRVDRRRAMLLANSARAALVGALALLVLFDATTIWLLYVMALLIGTVETVADSAAQALIPAVVSRSGLESANGKLQSAEIVGQTFLGGPLGSLTFVAGASLPFLLNSVGFALAALFLLAIRGQYRPRVVGPAPRLRTQLGEGLGWVRRRPLMVRLLVFAAALAAISELAQALLVLYALDGLRLNEAAFGVFALVGGVGGLLGAALTARLTRAMPRRTVLALSVVGCGAAFTAMGLVTEPISASILFGLFAACIVVLNVIIGALRHALIPEHLFGRVLGVWRTAVWGAIPVGALLGGALAAWLDVRAVFLVSGVLQLGLAGALWLVLGHYQREIAALDADEPEPDDPEPIRHEQVMPAPTPEPTRPEPTPAREPVADESATAGA